jgi:hypothetical protein
VFERERTEVALEWGYESDAGDVTCRSMLDHVSADWTTVDDLKTCESAHPRDVERSFLKYGYDIQHAAYVHAAEALKPELAGRVKMRFVFVETEPPFGVSIVVPDGAMREYGNRRWHRAATVWAGCTIANKWPDYEGEQTVTVPAWALAQEEEEQHREGST